VISKIQGHGSFAREKQGALVEMRSKMVKAVTATWRLWLAVGLGVLGTLSAVLSLSIGSNTMFLFLALSVLITLVGLVQFSLWSTLRRSWL
jgi:hypothetical protein